MNVSRMIYNRHTFLAILTVLGISLFNFWIYWIYENNFLIGELLIIETVLLYLSTISRNKTISISIFIIITFLSFILLKNHFDKNIFTISTVESIRIHEREQYYNCELGKIYGNRIGIYYFNNLKLIFGKISDHLFSALDLNLYFSPAFLIDYAKYPPFFAPLFVAGFLTLLTKIRKAHWIYLIVSLFVSSFISLDTKLGPLLILPLVSLCIAIGLMKLIEISKKIILKILNFIL